ncbi:hypothetical protein SKAU_G00399220 [Synaphobranchus kaupii]|uniref:Uncharacterized protein n=1 Tax=Synaphobranchus kaupii TaxID=118154 RepID=A0A9Q1E8N7_SYNKA|nr:hypothetical protein SKAU_G00399220 [Synaphobranchus kaupii]
MQLFENFRTQNNQSYACKPSHLQAPALLTHGRPCSPGTSAQSEKGVASSCCSRFFHSEGHLLLNSLRRALTLQGRLLIQRSRPDRSMVPWAHRANGGPLGTALIPGPPARGGGLSGGSEFDGLRCGRCVSSCGRAASSPGFSRLAYVLCMRNTTPPGPESRARPLMSQPPSSGRRTYWPAASEPAPAQPAEM